jgi:hypothetical protein
MVFSPAIRGAAHRAAAADIADPYRTLSRCLLDLCGEERHSLFAEWLYVLTSFILAVLLGRVRHSAGCCLFKVSRWAISLPLAACAIAAVRFAAAWRTGSPMRSHGCCWPCHPRHYNTAGTHALAHREGRASDDEPDPQYCNVYANGAGRPSAVQVSNSPGDQASVNSFAS